MASSIDSALLVRRLIEVNVPNLCGGCRIDEFGSDAQSRIILWLVMVLAPAMLRAMATLLFLLSDVEVLSHLNAAHDRLRLNGQVMLSLCLLH